MQQSVYFFFNFPYFLIGLKSARIVFQKYDPNYLVYQFHGKTG